MKTLILGAGNLLLWTRASASISSDTCKTTILFHEVELFDAGTLGLMAGHKLEEADRVYIVDVIAAPGEPGACVRYSKEDFLVKRIPVILSPHQIGVQEMLLVSSLRGRCPEEVFLLGGHPLFRGPGNRTHAAAPASAARTGQATGCRTRGEPCAGGQLKRLPRNPTFGGRRSPGVSRRAVPASAESPVEPGGDP